MRLPLRWGRRPRARDERGAVAVTVALLMVPLIGFAALAVDVSSLYAQRQQLQTGADAAALAIASNCLRGSCGTPTSTATDLAAKNLDEGTSTATVPSRTSTSVTVQNDATHSYVFAPVLGIRSTPLSVSATATWGAPTLGIGVLPVVVNLCEYNYQTNGGLPTSTTSRVIYLSRTTVSSCTESGFSYGYNPGGFAWVRPNYYPLYYPCATASAIAGSATSAYPSELQVSTSTSPPSGCSSSIIATYQNDVVLLPIFTAGRGSGSSAYFRIYGYAPFKLTGYYFGSSSLSWNAPCSGSDRCLRGYFTREDDQSSLFNYGSAPSLGAGFVQLTD